MEDNQPTTAREWLSRKRREECEFHAQNPTNGADFECLMAQSQNESWEEIEKRRALIFAATRKPPQIFGKDVD